MHYPFPYTHLAIAVNFFADQLQLMRDAQLMTSTDLPEVPEVQLPYFTSIYEQQRFAKQSLEINDWNSFKDFTLDFFKANPRSSVLFGLDKDKVVGVNNSLYWRAPADLKRFKERTSNGIVLMGANTLASFKPSYEEEVQPLPERLNIFFSQDANAYYSPAFYRNTSKEKFIASSSPLVLALKGYWPTVILLKLLLGASKAYTPASTKASLKATSQTSTNGDQADFSLLPVKVINKEEDKKVLSYLAFYRQLLEPLMTRYFAWEEKEGINADSVNNAGEVGNSDEAEKSTNKKSLAGFAKSKAPSTDPDTFWDKVLEELKQLVVLCQRENIALDKVALIGGPYAWQKIQIQQQSRIFEGASFYFEQCIFTEIQTSLEEYDFVQSPPRGFAYIDLDPKTAVHLPKPEAYEEVKDESEIKENPLFIAPISFIGNKKLNLECSDKYYRYKYSVE